MQQKDIRLDVHTHTIASGHAYSSLQEMVSHASELGLDILGITEHGPALPGAPDAIYFRNLHVIPREIMGVKLLVGVELNILDTKGTVDLDDWHLVYTDIRIAGIHSLCYKPGTREENTDGLIACMKNPKVQIISHPGDGTADLLFEPVVLAAKETGTLLEINNSSMKPCRGKLVAHDNNLEILRLCKKYDVPVILGSDAHISYSIADYQYLYPLLAEADFPDALVLNDKPSAFLSSLK